MEIEVNDLIDYELCPYPPSLFESSAFLRKAENRSLQKLLLHVKKQCELPASEENVDCYVLDGGSLLHRLAWNKNST